LLNRLISVTKNGTIVAEYGYDPGGVRAVKKVYQNGVNTDRIHYVFEGTEPIFEKRISDSRVRSYIYALGRYLARVDGVIGDNQAKVYHYHADYAGSIKAVTDQAGRIVYNADYLPFGTQISKSGDFDELRGFTGKEYDPDIGLYYFNARWYDPELGRFISEDPAADPNNCNLYSYCGNNPIMRADPTGKFWLTLLISALAGGISSASNGGNFMEGFVLGGLGACVGIGIGDVLVKVGMGSFGAAVLGGGLSGGVMGAMQGGDFWSSFGTGLFSAGVTFGLDKLFPGGKDIFHSKDPVGQALLSGFKMELRSLITSGKGISFLDFVEGLCHDYAKYKKKATKAGRAGADSTATSTATNTASTTSTAQTDNPLFPMGGFEPDRDDDLWNGELKKFNNCLTYMLNLIDNMGTAWPEGGLTAQALEDLTGISFNGANMKQIITSLGNRLNLDITWVPMGENGLPSISFSDYLSQHPGAYRGAYMDYTLGGRLDYHFIRQDSDGYWSWKDGATEVYDVDINGNRVIDPRSKNASTYTIYGYQLSAYLYISPKF
jgi:RHS repeat-associated protein